MSVKIICDSACDLPQSEGEKLNTQIIPLRYLLGEQEYLDGVTISNTEFYQKLENENVFPKTSQITQFQYSEAFQKALKEYDEVLCMTMSYGVSGCYQSAVMAAEEFGDKVRVFDSRHFCFSYALLVKYAVSLRDQGLCLNEIYEKLVEKQKKVRIIAAFNTLEYLKKGGRIPAAFSHFGNALGIKPIVTITDGKVEVLKLVRGSKKAAITVNSYLEDCDIDESEHIYSGYTGTTSEELDNFMSNYGNAHFSSQPEKLIVGTTVGSYAGPGAYAFAFFVK